MDGRAPRAVAQGGGVSVGGTARSTLVAPSNPSMPAVLQPVACPLERPGSVGTQLRTEIKSRDYPPLFPPDAAVPAPVDGQHANAAAAVRYTKVAPSRLAKLIAKGRGFLAKPVKGPVTNAANWAAEQGISNAARFELPAGQSHAQNAAAVDSRGQRVTLTRGDTIVAEPVHWLWPGYLVQGKLHILAGAGGTGKTTIALSLAAEISRGGKLPDGTRAPHGDALIWSGEDGAADTLVPRLRAAGADMTRIHFVDGVVGNGGKPMPFDPSVDFQKLERAAERIPNLRLMIVDSIASAITGDSHKNGEVRRGLQPVVDFAAHRRCAILGITHFTKGTQGREPTERVTGSLAFGALARVVLCTAKSANKGGAHVLVRTKSNLGPDGGGFEYTFESTPLDDGSGIVASRVKWGDAIKGSAGEILNQAEQPQDAPNAQTPTQFLRVLLKDGPKPVSEIRAAAAANGYSMSQMHRARPKLGAVVKKLGMKEGWEWSLSAPPEDHEGDENHEDHEDRGIERAPSSTSPSAETSPEDDVDRTKIADTHEPLSSQPSTSSSAHGPTRQTPSSDVSEQSHVGLSVADD